MSASCEFKTSNIENAYHIGFCEDPVNCVLVGTQNVGSHCPPEASVESS